MDSAQPATTRANADPKSADYRSYLQGTQYRDSGNLKARRNLHARFSTNPEGWWTWMWRQAAPFEGIRVLDLGCGPGWMWRGDAPKPEFNFDATLADYSKGMVDEARAALADDARFRFTQVDAQVLPFETDSFDLVVANHMLYHVADVATTLAEIARVLAPGGRLIAASNGRSHLAEIKALAQDFDVRYQSPGAFGLRFSLEGGAADLKAHFKDIEVRRRENGLRVDDAGALADYVASMSTGEPWANQAWRDGLEAFIAERIEAQGPVMIRKDSGLVVGRKR